MKKRRRLQLLIIFLMPVCLFSFLLFVMTHNLNLFKIILGIAALISFMLILVLAFVKDRIKD